MNSTPPTPPPRPIPLCPGLADGAIVRLAPSRRRILSRTGQIVTRPRIGVRLRFRREGSVTLPDGCLAGGDPMTGDCRVLARKVAPGTYLVETVIAETAADRVVALAVIRFRDQPAHRCRLALFEGEDPTEVTDDMSGGMGTDSGTIMLGEPLRDPERVYEQDQPFFRPLIDQTNNGEPRAHAATGPSQESLWIWPSGYGDGLHTPYWGVDRAGSPCFFAVDFGIIANGLHGPVVRCKSVGASLELVPISRWQRFLDRWMR